MLEIGNLEEDKSDRQLNETYVILPLDGDYGSNRNSDKFVRDTMALSSFGESDQTVFASGYDHTLLIGLDRNLLEMHNNKGDLLVIQNPGVKFVQCTSESKSPIAYTISYAEQNKNEILWDGSLLKEKLKPDWCSGEKTIFDEKDDLNYDESVQEISKSWGVELPKQDQSQLLRTEVSKIDDSIIMPPELIKDSVKKLESATDFLHSYNTTTQTPDLMSAIGVPAIGKTLQTTIKDESANFTEITFEKTSDDSLGTEILNNSTTECLESIKESVPDVCCMNGNPIKCDNPHEQNNVGTRSQEHKEQQDKEIDFSEVPQSNVTDKSCLPEKSLPLKKKAKMKSTCESGVLTRQNLEVLGVGNERSEIHLGNGVISGKTCKANYQQLRQRKQVKVRKGKKVTDCGKEITKIDESPHEQPGLTEVETECSVPLKGVVDCDFKNANSIFDVVESLRKFRLINSSVCQILHSGLREMDVDILEEMRTKFSQNSPTEDVEYSAHLKAFALMLYFKQPSAFHQMSKIYKKGWPSLRIIKYIDSTRPGQRANSEGFRFQDLDAWAESHHQGEGDTGRKRCTGERDDAESGRLSWMLFRTVGLLLTLVGYL